MRIPIRARSFVFACGLTALAGCNGDARRDANFRSTRSAEPSVNIEGTIYSLAYEGEDGKMGGFTRLNTAAAVPAGNGSWNVDAYGRLTDDYLIITYPQRKGLGPRVIPVRRIVDIQFGDGGISTVNENQPSTTGG
ncbi:MAG: hypothetical protein ABI557_01300 [Aureliella sp.]